MLIRLKRLSLVLVAIGNISMTICNCFHARLANNGKKMTFRDYRSLTASCTSFLESTRSRLGPLKSKFNAENLYAACLGLSVVISVQFSIEMSRSPKSPTKSMKPVF